MGFHRRGLGLTILACLTVAVGLVAVGNIYISHLAAKTQCARQSSTGCAALPIVLRNSGQAMVPTLADGQSLTADPGAYKAVRPKRGDVIAFDAPGLTGRPLIRRIIATPGDQVYMVKGSIRIDGQTLVEPYVINPWTFDTDWPRGGAPVIVPPGKYFVLGDNRDHSVDSRSFGFIGFESIVGRVPLVHFSPTASP